MGLLFAMLPEGFTVFLAGRSPSITFFDLAIILVVAFLVWENVVGDYWFDWGDKTLFHLALAYFFYLMFSTLFHMGDVLRGFNSARIFTFGFLTYIACVSLLKSKRDVGVALDGLTLWGGLIGLILAYQFFYRWQFDVGLAASYQAKGEIGISMGGSNYIAAMLVPILPIVLANLTERRRWGRVIPAAAIFLMALGLIITASKGAFLAVFAGFLLGLPLMKKAGLKLWPLPLFCLATIGLLLVLPGHLFEYNYQMILFRLNNPDASRFHLWRIAWAQFLQHPFFGIGPGNIYLYNFRGGEQDLYSHNYILEILAELGIFGAALFFIMLGILVKKAYRLFVSSLLVKPRSIVPLGLFLGLVCTLLHGLVEPTFEGEQYSVIFWACMGLVVVLEQQTNDAKRIEARRNALIRSEYLADTSSSLRQQDYE